MANDIDWQSQVPEFVAQTPLSVVEQQKFPEILHHIWIKTSGSSGRQKWVALSKDAVMASAQAVNQHLQSSAADIWGLTIPDFHIGGLAIRARSFLSAAQVVDYRTSNQFADGDKPQSAQFDKWQPIELCQRLVADGVSLLSIVPTQLHDIVSLQIAAPKSLRAVFVGGGYLQEQLRLKAVSLGWPIITTYGMTETASQVCASAVGDTDLHVLSHAQVRISDCGETEIKAESLFSGYGYLQDDGVIFEDPKVAGWFLTSDLGELSERGYRWLGRIDRCIKSKGVLYNLDALEIEIATLCPQYLRDKFFVHFLPDERIEHEIVVVTLQQYQSELTELLAKRGRFEELSLASIKVLGVQEIKRTGIGKLDRLATVRQIAQ